MNEETKRLIDEVQGIIDDAAAEKKDRNTEPDEIEIRQAAENFRDIMTRNGVDYFLSGKYQPKGDPKPKAFISLHGPSEGILRAMGGAPCQLVRYQPPKRPKKKRCHLSKALRAYRKDHEGAEGT